VALAPRLEDERGTDHVDGGRGDGVAAAAVEPAERVVGDGAGALVARRRRRRRRQPLGPHRHDALGVGRDGAIGAPPRPHLRRAENRS